MHEIYSRQAIEAGLADSCSGRTTDVEQVRSKSGCPSEGSLGIKKQIGRGDKLRLIVTSSPT